VLTAACLEFIPAYVDASRVPSMEKYSFIRACLRFLREIALGEDSGASALYVRNRKHADDVAPCGQIIQRPREKTLDKRRNHLSTSDKARNERDALARTEFATLSRPRIGNSFPPTFLHTHNVKRCTTLPRCDVTRRFIGSRGGKRDWSSFSLGEKRNRIT